MAARKPGRYLAPVALLVTAAAIALLVRERLDSGSGVATTTTAFPATLAHSPPPKKLHRPPRRIFYVVKPGDTLSGIALRTGIPMATLQALNPGIDPNALQTGQRLRLRR